MAGSVRFELTSDGFGDRYVTVTPRTYMAEGVRFERTHTGVKVRCLNRLATLLYKRGIYLPSWLPQSIAMLYQPYLFVGRFSFTRSFAFIMVSYLL